MRPVLIYTFLSIDKQLLLQENTGKKADSKDFFQAAF